jgi:hypothetical protein
LGLNIKFSLMLEKNEFDCEFWNEYILLFCF